MLESHCSRVNIEMGMLGSRIRRKAARFEYNKETPRAFGVDRESKSGRSQVVGIFLQCLLTDSFLFGSSTQQRTYFLDKCLWGVGGGWTRFSPITLCGLCSSRRCQTVIFDTAQHRPPQTSEGLGRTDMVSSFRQARHVLQPI